MRMDAEVDDVKGAPRAMKLGPFAAPGLFDFPRHSTLVSPMLCWPLPAYDEAAHVLYSSSRSSRLTPRPARRLFRACSIRRKKRGSCSRWYSNQSSSDSKPIGTPAVLP